MLDTSKIRKDFPIFKNHPKLIYFDNAATSHKPRRVVRAVSDFYEKYNSNIHRGIYSLAEKATEKYENTRKKVAQFINAKTEEIIFTKSTTEAINLVAFSLARSKFVKKNDNIIVTIMEHHSSLVPWQRFCQESGLNLKIVPVDGRGHLNLEKLYQLINKKTKLLVVTHISNVLGTINPIDEIISQAKSINPKIKVLVDGAQSIPHIPVNVKKLDCDFLAFSGHKMLGPTGVGVLYAKANLLENLPPFLLGGEMISEVKLKKSTWNDIPHKFEAGTPNIAQVIGLGAAIDYLKKIGLNKIKEHEKELVRYSLEKFKTMSDVKVYGPDNIKERGSVISFNLKGIHPHDLATLLDRDNIAIRAGHHCAMPLHNQVIKNQASARISFYFYNSKVEIDKFFKSLKKAQKLLSV
jgi:cysteine desulfurase/selenocysteine lyase